MRYRLLEALCRETYYDINDYSPTPFRHHSESQERPSALKKWARRGVVGAALGAGALAGLGGAQGIMKRRQLHNTLAAAKKAISSDELTDGASLVRKIPGLKSKHLDGLSSALASSSDPLSTINSAREKLPGYHSYLWRGMKKPLTSVEGLKDTLYRGSGLSIINRGF